MRADSGNGSLRALVVTGTILREQGALWEAIADERTTLTVVGADLNVYEGRWPWASLDFDGVDCIRLPVRQLRGGRGPIWWWYPGLAELVDERRPDVLHVLTEPWSTLVAQSLAIARARSWVGVVAHGCDNQFTHGSAWEQTARRAALRLMLRRLDGYVSWNREGALLAERFGPPRSGSVPVIPAVVPHPAEFAQPGENGSRSREAFGIPPDRTVIGFIGRLTAEKGVRELLQALEAMESPDRYCAVWGAGALEAELTDFFRARPSIGALHGSLPLAEVPKALAACDLLALPSKTTREWKEQFGRIAVEAMHAGVPVVASTSGALPEVLGDAGVLVDEGDAESLARALDRLVEEGERRAVLAARGRRRASSLFDPQLLARRLIDYWSGLVEYRQRRLGHG